MQAERCWFRISSILRSRSRHPQAGAGALRNAPLYQKFLQEVRMLNTFRVGINAVFSVFYSEFDPLASVHFKHLRAAQSQHWSKCALYLELFGTISGKKSPQVHRFLRELSFCAGGFMNCTGYTGYIYIVYYPWMLVSEFSAPNFQ